MPLFPKLDGSVEIFCSYSHQDDSLRKEFENSVALLRRQKLVQIWHDRQILAGEDWAGDIDEHLNSADMITLFVSADFLASDYCYDKELSRALEREKQNEVLIVPIIVRPCDWDDAPFAHLQVIPSGLAVTSWTNRDEAWKSVAVSLKGTVRKVLSRKLETLEKLQSSVRASASDEAQARAVFAQMARDSAAQTERWRIMAELQSKIFAINQEIGPVLPPPKKRAEDALKSFEGYIK